jgi:phage I-like protein
MRRRTTTIARAAGPATHPLEPRVRRLEAEQHEASRREFIDGALASGRVTEQQRESLEALFNRDPVAARAVVAGLPPAQPVVARAFTETEDEAYKAGAASRLGLKDVV